MKKLSLGLLALCLSSFVATHVYAYQVACHRALGLALWQWQHVCVYPPWRIGFWAWYWGTLQPDLFQISAGAGLLAGLLVLAPLMRQQRLRVQSETRWVTPGELRQRRLFAPTGVVLGKVRRHIVRHNGTEHVLCIAPTQSGKSTAVVMPTLLSIPQWSVLVHDAKDEIAPRTAHYRATCGPTHLFAPLRSLSARYNPLDTLRLKTVHEIRDAQVLADVLFDPEGDADLTHRDGASTHFRELCSDIGTGLLLYGLHSQRGRHLGALNELVTIAQTWDGLIKDLARHDHPIIQRAGIIAGRLADRELSGVQTTITRALRVWSDPLVVRATQHSDFQLTALRHTDRPMTLYLSIPFGDQARLRLLTQILTRQVLDVATQTVQYSRRLLLVLDEFLALRRVPALAEGLTYLAGYGVMLLLVTPSLHGLEVYGPMEQFTEGCRYKVVFAPEDDVVAAKFSRLTCETAVERQREMVAREPFHALRERTTISREVTQEPLLSPTQLMQLSPKQALLLLGNGRAALVQKAWYWKRREWRQRVSKAP